MKKFFADVSFVVKRFIFALGLTYLIFLTKGLGLRIIILANLTNQDGLNILIGDILPWILVVITWWYFFSSIKTYYQKVPTDQEPIDQH